MEVDIAPGGLEVDITPVGPQQQESAGQKLADVRNSFLQLFSRFHKHHETFSKNKLVLSRNPGSEAQFDPFVFKMMIAHFSAEEVF